MKGIRYLGILAMVLGVVGLVAGIVAVRQGGDITTQVTDAMVMERVTYGGDLVKLTPAGIVEVDEEIVGIVDTAIEAQYMADVLKAHRSEQGFYSELERDDPARDTILKAITMENSLTLAQMGFAAGDMATKLGGVLAIIGIAIVGLGVGLYRLSGRVS